MLAARAISEPSQTIAPATWTPSAIPARDRFSTASALWQSGFFDRCLVILESYRPEEHTSESTLLTARALLRLKRHIEAESFLQGSHYRHRHVDAIATSYMLLGTATAQNGNLGNALHYFDKAIQLTPHPSIAAETLYYKGLAYYAAARYDDAQAAVHSSLPAAADIILARAQSLLGWIALSQNRFDEAVNWYEQTLETLGVSTANDIQLFASTLYAIVILESEYRLRDPHRLDRIASTITWTASLRTEQIQTIRHLGRAFAQTGNFQLAFTRYAQAAAIAPFSGWAIMCLADIADLARGLGDTSASVHLHLAQEYANAIEWQTISGEERLALLALSLACARAGNVAEATKYYDIYKLDPKLSDLHSLSHDARLATLCTHVEGLIAAASPVQTGKGKRLLIKAQEQWTSLQYHRRALEARADLDRIYNPACRQTCSQHDRTECLYRPIVLTAAPPPTTVTPDIPLTPALQRVLPLLLAGKSYQDIADELTLSIQTVKNSASRIYDCFGVEKRNELMARYFQTIA